jgi:hypothetical protein
VSAALDGFRAAYTLVVQRHVAEPGEVTLREAYELGRDAVGQDLSVLDLAAAHHEVLAGVLRTHRGDDAAALSRTVGDVFRESLSAFEMVRRGFQEARDTVRLQRRQAEMVRQLSSFLADASLALDAGDSVGEVLRLVAEQARELVDAGACVAAVRTEARAEPVRAVSAEADEDAWTAVATALEDEVAAAGGVADGGVGERPALGAEAAALRASGSLRDWLAAPITALDGRPIGSIQLFDKRGGPFGEVDEAVVVHLAQMAAAAVERAGLYSAPGP